MTRSELVDALTERQSNLGKTEVEWVVNCLFTQMTNALVHGERIEIRGFGSFTLHHKPPCIGRNPKTGEAVQLAAKVTVHFKPGKEIRERVNASRNIA